MDRQKFIDGKVKGLEKLCRSRGIPLTVQRRVILEAVAGRKDHPTVDQVYEAVKGLLPGVSKTTVYRVLETFVQMGMAIRVSNPGATTRFDADTRRHHHLVCLACDAVIDCPPGFLEKLDIPEPGVDGFRVKDFSLTITGFCASCSQAAPDAKA